MNETNFRYFTLIPHSTKNQILLVKEQAGWSLPHVNIKREPNDHLWREVALINEATRQNLALNVTTLYCLDLKPNQKTGTFVMENHDQNWLAPNHTQWVDFEDLAQLNISDNEQRSLLEKWLKETPPELKWAERGWFDEASKWINEQLQANSIVAIEQLRSWFLSCILKVKTTSGDYYFKAVPELFGYEPALTALISKTHPTMAPQVIAIDTTRRWLLMKSVNGIKLNQYPINEAYYVRLENLLADFARLQLDFSKQTDNILNLGCPDVRLAKIPALIEEFAAEAPILLKDKLPQEQIEQLISYMPFLQGLCLHLATYNLPAALNHGDFHEVNILADETDYVLLDWAGFIALSFPLCFIMVIMQEHTDPQIQQRLLTSYLQHWTSYEPIERLLEAFELCQPLAVVLAILGHLSQLKIATNDWEREQEWHNIFEVLTPLLA